jgi:hypothetical protein
MQQQVQNLLLMPPAFFCSVDGGAMTETCVEGTPACVFLTCRLHLAAPLAARESDTAPGPYRVIKD